MPTIKITRSYTLPHNREGRGRVRTETLTWDTDDWRDPVAWAVEELTNAGCVRDNGRNYITEESKITDSSRGEEMGATAELTGFTDAQQAEIFRKLNA